MATSWKSQQGDGMYSLQFETDDKEKYKLVEKASQMAIDGITDIAEVKHGEWMESDIVYYRPHCSLCDYEHFVGAFFQYSTNYCPNCGAKMDGGKKE